MGISVEYMKPKAEEFIRRYAVEHQFFTGGDVLAAFREAGHPDPDGGWRNVWGGLILACSKKGWFVKSGRASPTSSQSHTTTLVQWESRLYEGVPSLMGVSVHAQLNGLRLDVLLRKINVMTALQKAYDLGAESK